MTASEVLPFTKRQLSGKTHFGFISLHCIFNMKTLYMIPLILSSGFWEFFCRKKINAEFGKRKADLWYRLTAIDLQM